MPGMSVQLYSVCAAFARDPGGTLRRLAGIGLGDRVGAPRLQDGDFAIDGLAASRAYVPGVDR